MSLQARKILAIDDSTAILTFLRISLELQGADFYTANTAADGIRLCNEIKPDLVILDLGLPDRDGIEVLPELCRPNDTSASPTVIVLTVRKEQAIRQKALELGASAYLTKPFLMEELLEVMGEHLEEG